jgi:hypothetical protein
VRVPPLSTEAPAAPEAAREPAADFSWLEAPAEREAHEPTPTAAAEAALIENDGGAPAEPESHAPPVLSDPAGSAVEASERDEFAWLDAPLPPEEDEAPPVADPAPGSDAPDRADVVAGGALPGLPPMPASEDSPTPTTDREPPDSPQPNASAKRGAPAPGKIGLTTDRTS